MRLFFLWWKIFLFLSTLTTQSIGYVYISSTAGITFPYETTIIGTIENLLNKYGLELPSDGDFGKPNRIGWALNFSAGYAFFTKFHTTIKTGIWKYHNLNQYGLFKLQTVPINIGVEYQVLQLSPFNFLFGVEFPLFLNYTSIESEVYLPGNLKPQVITFLDNYLLYGLNIVSNINLAFLKSLYLTVSHKISYIPRTNKPLLYFNYFLGLKFWVRERLSW